MNEQSITVTDSEITIKAQFFVHKDYSVLGKDLILDVLGKYYTGQRIVVCLWDGENIEFSGFKNFLMFVCEKLKIPHDKIYLETHDYQSQHPFQSKQLQLGIFLSVNQYLPKNFDRSLKDAKFLGCLLGRYNFVRLRLAYELDRAFPNDTFINFQPTPEFVKNSVKHVDDLYRDELEWIQNKKFDRDLTSGHYMGMIDWYDACRNYDRVWNRYQIEVVSETDAMDDFWFTEKTANCLSTGKPFVLVSGQGSLRRLQDMGFETFGDILDESYDQATSPYERIQRLTTSLQQVYNNSERSEIVDRLYQKAAKNIELYQQYIWK